jgi:hypothetical protein
VRTLLLVCTLSLLVIGGATSIRSQEEQPSPEGTRLKPNTRETPEQIRKRGADWLAQCLQDWDAGTHLTKKDWQRVCRRVAGERINELIKQSKQ